MYSEMIDKVFAQSPAIAAPVVKLNKLAAEQFEKVANVQLDACKAMAELSLSELKSLAAVSDFDSAKAFWARQGDVARAVRHQQSLYAKALSDLGNEFGSKLKKISQEDVKLAA